MALTLEEFLPKARQLNPDYTDDEHIQAYEQRYGRSAPIQTVSPAPLTTFDDFLPKARALNPEYSDEEHYAAWQEKYGARGAREKDQGDFWRGGVTAFKQIPQTVRGLEAGAGAIGEKLAGEGGLFTALKAHGLKGYQEHAADIAKDSKPSDSVTEAYQMAKAGDPGALVDWLQYALGYGGGQALQMLATAGIGYAGGKLALQPAAKAVAEKMIAKESARLAATGMVGEQLAKQAVSNVAGKIGQTAALGATALGMEGGEIYGGLVEKAAAEGRSLTGEELAKATGATLAAGALEFLGDKIGLDLVMGKSLAGKLVSSRLGHATAAGSLGVATEGGTEFTQTLIEEFGKGNDPFSPESLKQAVDASALGGVGGAAIGAAGGVIRRPDGQVPEPVVTERQPDEMGLTQPIRPEVLPSREPFQIEGPPQPGEVRGGKVYAGGEVLDVSPLPDVSPILKAGSLDDAIASAVGVVQGPTETAKARAAEFARVTAKAKNETDALLERAPEKRPAFDVPILPGPEAQPATLFNQPSPIVPGQAFTPRPEPINDPWARLADERARMVEKREQQRLAQQANPVSTPVQPVPAVEPTDEGPLPSQVDLAYPSSKQVRDLIHEKGLHLDTPVFREYLKMVTGREKFTDLTPQELQKLAEKVKTIKAPQQPAQVQEAPPQVPLTPAEKPEQPYAPVTTIPEAQVPRSELTPEKNAEILLRAEKAKADMEIAGTERGGRFFGETTGQGSTQEVTGLKSPTADWYKELTSGPGAIRNDRKQSAREKIEVAIAKIIKDQGADRGKAVEQVKAALLQDREFHRTEWGRDLASIMQGEWPSYIEKPEGVTQATENTEQFQKVPRDTPQVSLEEPKAIKVPPSRTERLQQQKQKMEAKQQPVSGFKTAKGSTYVIGENGTTTRDKAARPEHPGPKERGIQPVSEQTFYVDKKGLDALGEFQTQGGPKKRIVVKGDKAAIQYRDGKDAGKFEARTVTGIKKFPAVGLYPVELWKGGERVHFGNAITEVHAKQPEPSPSETPRVEPQSATAQPQREPAAPTSEAAPTTERQEDDFVPETDEEIAAQDKRPLSVDEIVEAFMRSSHSIANARERWDKRRARGLTDQELKEAIAYEFVVRGGSSGPRQRSIMYNGGSNPVLEIEKQLPIGKVIKGKDLLTLARKVLAIPTPNEAVSVRKSPLSVPSEPEGENFSLTAPEPSKPKAKETGTEQLSIDVPPPTSGERPIIGREATLEEAPLFSKNAQEPDAEQVSLPEGKQNPTFTDETVASYSGQTNHVLRAELPDGKSGRLEYVVYRGEPSISFISVPDKNKRSGIATALVRELQRKFPDNEIEWGMTTPEGTALKESLPWRTVKTEYYDQFKRLDRINAQIADMNRRSEAETLSPEEYGKLNDLNDQAYELRKSLEDKSPTKQILSRTPDAEQTPIPEESAQAIAPDIAPAQSEPEQSPEPAQSPTDILASALRQAADQIQGGASSQTIDTPEKYSEFRKRLLAGEVTLDEYKQAFQQVNDNRTAIIAALKKLNKDQLIKLSNSFYARKSESKDSLIEQAYDGMLRGFALGRGVSYAMTGKGSYERAMAKLVEETTADDLAKFAEEVEKNTAEYKARVQGFLDPKTLEDFDARVRIKGEDSLTPEQLARYDELLARAGREKRKQAQAQKSTVQGVDAGTDLQMVESKHTKTGEKLWVVKLANRVDRSVYDRLNQAAHKLGGRYSSYNKDGAIPGFTFRSEEAAKSFMAAGKGETVSAAPVKEAATIQVQNNAVAKLREMADSLEGKADESLNADRKTNTAKRASQASHAESEAYKSKALAETMRNLADAIESGEATHLSGLRTKAQVEMLDSMLERAKYDRIKKETKGSYVDYERQKDRPADPQDAAHATYPTLDGSKSELLSTYKDLATIRGADRLRNRFYKLAESLGEDQRVPLNREDVELAIEKYPRKSGLPWHWPENLAKIKRLESMGITSLPELRAALREFVEYRGKRGTTDKAKQLERELIGNKGVGNDFFPTPKETAQRMVAEAGIEPGMSVLEPSAGNGNIAEVIRAAGVNPDVVEQSSRLREVLEAKGFNVVEHDFMDLQPINDYFDPAKMPYATWYTDTMRRYAKTLTREEIEKRLGVVSGQSRSAADIHRRAIERSTSMQSNSQARAQSRNVVAALGQDRIDLSGALDIYKFYPEHTKTGGNPVNYRQYDRIVMNPPFSNGQDAEHIQHAYELLKPGGKLVAIAGEGIFFRNDAKAMAFREWLDQVGGTSEKLPEGTFKDSSLMATTGANTRMVVVEKAGGALPQVNRAQADEEVKRDGGLLNTAGQQEEPASTDQAPLIRQVGIPASTEPVIFSYRKNEQAKLHKDYAAAKGGDIKAAVRLVEKLVKPDTRQAVAERFDGAVFVAPMAQEATGRNAIPQALAAHYANAANGSLDTQIVQVNQPRHTGADPMQRIIARAQFDGPVQEGQRYVLVDDNLTLGGTLADLSDHIQRNGGEVAGIVVLTNANRSDTLQARPKQIRTIEERFGDVLREQLAIDPQALTGLEADYLIGLRNADALTNRATKASREREQRLSAKGLSRTEDSVTPASDSESPQSDNPKSPFSFLSDERGSIPASFFSQDKNATGTIDPPIARERLKESKASLRPYLLGALGLEQLSQVYGKDHAEVRQYNKATQDMEADFTEMSRESDKVARAWTDLHIPVADKMAKVMEDARFLNFDPDPRKKQEADSAKKQELVTRFEQLPDDAKSVYRMARDFYTNMAEQRFQALKERIERAGGTPENTRKLVDRLQIAYEGVRSKVYFPFTRFGENIVVAKQMKDGKEVDREVHAFESVAEAAKFATMMKMKGWQVKQTVAREYSVDKEGPASKIVRQMHDIIKELGQGQQGLPGVMDLEDQLLDSLNQSFLQALPDMSYAKHFIHAKDVKGASRDALRSFAHSALHGAHHISRIRHADKVTNALIKLDDKINKTEEGDTTEARQVYNELVKRHNDIMNPNTHPVSAWLGQLGFTMSLGGVVATGVTNATQVPLVTYPWLGARYGFGKASAALARAYKDFLDPRTLNKDSLFDASKSKLISESERKMLQELARRGRIDLTQTMDLAGLSSQDNLSRKARLTGTLNEKVTRMLGFTFHAPEVMNRQVTALSTFRLEKEKGGSFDEALQRAEQAIIDTQFLYQSFNRPRYMSGNFLRVLTMFRQYSQNIAYTYGRAASIWLDKNNATKEERQVAKRQLVSMLALQFGAAGALGMPFFGSAADVLMAVVGAFGDDDDKREWEVALRKWLDGTATSLAEAFIDDKTEAAKVGKEMAEVVSHGASRLTPWDMAGRLGQNDLFFREPQREREGRQAVMDWMLALGGPVPSYGVNFLLGMGDVAKGVTELNAGFFMRGVEELTPAVLRNGVKSLRYTLEGVRTRDEYKQLDLDTSEKLGQAFGFTPARVAEMYESTTAVKNKEHRILNEQKALKNRFARAVDDQDDSAKQRILDDIRAFNERNPIFAITSNTLNRSLKARRQHEAGMERGMYLPPRRRALLEEGDWGDF